MAKLLRPSVTGEMERPVCTTVRVTITAGHTPARLFRTPVICLIELLLRERREQQSESLDLFGIENPVEELVEVINRDQLSFCNVAQIGTRRQIDGGREFRKKMFGKIEVQVEASQVALLLFYHFLNLELREDHAPLGMVGMRQRQKSLRKQI